MLVKLDPRAGDKLGDQIDLANELLTKDYVDEVQLQMNDGLKFMRTPMDGDQIRKFIWEGYKNDIGIVTYYAEELRVIPFASKLYVVYDGTIVYSTSAYYENDVDKINQYGSISIEDALVNEYSVEDVKRWFIEWGEEHIVNFREDFDY